MPTYEYECSKCGKITEVFQSIKDAPRRKLRAEDKPACRCNAPVSRRIGTGGGLIFKGSGFYITDYRNESYKQAAKAEKEGTSGAAGEKKESAKKETGTSESAAPAAKERPAGKAKTKE